MKNKMEFKMIKQGKKLKTSKQIKKTKLSHWIQAFHNFFLKEKI
jgi:hypothetical protein